MKWFRLYDEILDDPKVQELHVEQRWWWLEFMCVASRQEMRGSLPALSRLAFHFRCSEDEAKRRLDILRKAGFIDVTSCGHKMHGWDGRQFKSDDVTVRTSKSKQKQSVPGNVPRNGQDNVPHDVPENVPRRVPKSVLGNAPETETETETESENFSSSEDSEKFKKTTTPLPPSGGSVVELSSEEKFPKFPDWRTTIITVQSGDHEIPETEARKIWGHVWRAWHSSKLCLGFYEYQRSVSVKGWLYAIESAVKQEQRPGHIKYLQTIGTDFDINGPKRVKPLRKGDIGSVPYKPTYSVNEIPGPQTFPIYREGT